MKIVLDTNVLFSIMNPSTVASYIFSLKGLEFFAPEHLKLEFFKYRNICLTKSELSEQEFEIRFEEIIKKVGFSSLSEYESYIKEADKALSDRKDSPFFALALSKGKIPIWSNDPHFKEQSVVEVFTTKELVEKLIRGELFSD